MRQEQKFGPIPEADMGVVCRQNQSLRLIPWTLLHYQSPPAAPESGHLDEIKISLKQSRDCRHGGGHDNARTKSNCVRLR